MALRPTPIQRVVTVRGEKSSYDDWATSGPPEPSASEQRDIDRAWDNFNEECDDAFKKFLAALKAAGIPEEAGWDIEPGAQSIEDPDRDVREFVSKIEEWTPEGFEEGSDAYDAAMEAASEFMDEVSSAGSGLESALEDAGSGYEDTAKPETKTVTKGWVVLVQHGDSVDEDFDEGITQALGEAENYDSYVGTMITSDWGGSFGFKVRSDAEGFRQDMLDAFEEAGMSDRADDFVGEVEQAPDDWEAEGGESFDEPLRDDDGNYMGRSVKGGGTEFTAILPPANSFPSDIIDRVEQVGGTAEDNGSEIVCSFDDAATAKKVADWIERTQPDVEIEWSGSKSAKIATGGNDLVKEALELAEEIVDDPDSDDYARAYADAMQTAYDEYGVEGVSAQILYILNNLKGKNDRLKEIKQRLKEIADELESSDEKTTKMSERGQAYEAYRYSRDELVSDLEDADLEDVAKNVRRDDYAAALAGLPKKSEFRDRVQELSDTFDGLEPLPTMDDDAGPEEDGEESAKPAAKGSQSDCVSDKIKKLMDEGYEQDQAIAIAYSYCGEDKTVRTLQTKCGDYPSYPSYSNGPSEELDQEDCKDLVPVIATFAQSLETIEDALLVTAAKSLQLGQDYDEAILLLNEVGLLADGMRSTQAEMTRVAEWTPDPLGGDTYRPKYWGWPNTLNRPIVVIERMVGALTGNAVYEEIVGALVTLRDQMRGMVASGEDAALRPEAGAVKRLRARGVSRFVSTAA